MNEENLSPGVEPEEEGHKLGRREAIKVGAAVAGGLALGMGSYVKASVVSVGVQETYAETTIVNPPPGEGGCTPGFWGGGAVNRNGRGYFLWDQGTRVGGIGWAGHLDPQDPNWLNSGIPLEWPYGTNPPADDQPFYAAERFSDFFPGWTRFTTQVSEADGFAGLRLDDFVPKTPPPPANTQLERLARACVAATLNAAWFGWADSATLHTYSIGTIRDMWAEGVAQALAQNSEDTDICNDNADLLDAANNGACAS